jgi:hypothetical protein
MATRRFDMRSATVTWCGLFVAGAVAAQTRPPLPPELQIRLAVQAAPAALRDSVTVQGWTAAGGFTTLRQGGAAIICVAPNPAAAQLEVSCHHRDLEAFLARGRELAAQGVGVDRRTRMRWDEITAGRLRLPSGVVNTIMTGSGFDSATGAILNPYTRWVIYVPHATAASTGLSDVPTGPGQPWLMFAGTPGAHIMISPPRASAPRP